MKPKHEFSINLIDVCLPDYLCDHCNREGEVLLSISVRNNTTIASAKAMLRDELNNLWDDRIPEELTSEKFANLLEEFMPEGSVRVAQDWKKALQYIDLSEEDDSEECHDECYAYFRLQFWTEEDESEEDESEEESAFVPLCENCSANTIQGVLCHEHGCSSAFQRPEGGF